MDRKCCRSEGARLCCCGNTSRRPIRPLKIEDRLQVVEYMLLDATERDKVGLQITLSNAMNMNVKCLKSLLRQRCSSNGI